LAKIQDWSSTLRTQRSGTLGLGGDHAAEVIPMIALGIGFLALFSLLSIVLGTDDPRRVDPRDDIRFWMRYGIR
jgi:hypothetical protein